MRYSVPHPIPYQGSKRRLAPAILSFIPKGRFRRMVEPFAGSAAVTLAAAAEKVCDDFLIADALRPLADLWDAIIQDPSSVVSRYRVLWGSQFEKHPIEKYNEIRAAFNQDHDPAKLLFLLARCVKNAVRFNPKGQFNQSADKRRKGTHPDTVEREIMAAHRLLYGRATVQAGDFRSVLADATPDDIVYLDPPYQGTSEGKDSRYFQSVPREAIIQLIENLNFRRIQFVLSYDGQCGSKTYGAALPARLAAQRVLLNVGTSSQATLNGRQAVTVESVYLSSGLARRDIAVEPMLLRRFAPQLTLL